MMDRLLPSGIFLLGLETLEEDVQSESDWEIMVARVRADEPGADSELIDQLWPKLVKIIVRLCPRREATEDLAQETFLRIFSKLSQWRGGDFEAWCCQIARRLCYDALRKRQVRPEWTFSELGETVQETAGQSQDGRENRDLLTVLFNQIPSEMAWLLTEIELRGESIGDLSKAMGWSATAGRLRLMRARRSLRNAFNQSELI